jgi:Aromatic acid exporter family member 2
MYTFLISVWIASKHKTAPNPTWIKSFRTKLLGIGAEVGSIRDLTHLARWEGSIRGAWPVEEYMQLVAVQSEMIASLAQVGFPLLFSLDTLSNPSHKLGNALGQLEDEWRRTFLHTTQVLNPYFVRLFSMALLLFVNDDRIYFRSPM